MVFDDVVGVLSDQLIMAIREGNGPGKIIVTPYMYVSSQTVEKVYGVILEDAANRKKKKEKKNQVIFLHFSSSKTSFFHFPIKSGSHLIFLSAPLSPHSGKKKSFTHLLWFPKLNYQLETSFLVFSRATLQWFKQLEKSALYTWPERLSNWSTRATGR
jgi:hypothetical protein